MEMQDRFSVYDVFAVLVPGAIFMYLSAFALDRAIDIKPSYWTGSVCDVAFLFVFGYAAGTLLQALGKALLESPWLWIHGAQPTATLPMPGLRKLSDVAKAHALEAIRAAYGELPMGEKDKGYRKLSEDRTYRAHGRLSPRMILKRSAS